MEDILYREDFAKELSQRKAEVKTFCPFCHHRRQHKQDRSLSINTTTGAYYCHCCGAKGVLQERNKRFIMKEYKVPSPVPFDRFGVVSDKMMAYFESRHISKATLQEARVTQESMFIGDGRKVDAIGFNYYLNQKLVNVKRRSGNKEFRLESGAQLIPYNINSLNEERYLTNEPRIAIITEGEFDALTWIECGYHHVVSVPNGANANLEWMDDFVESHFDPLEAIYISSDTDEKGLALKDELLRRFGKDRCRIVNYPTDCKDINEVICKYGKDEVVKCFDNAVEIRPEGLLEVSDMEQDLDNLFENGFQKGLTAQLGCFDDLLSVRTGLLMVTTGVPSHGKTYFLQFFLLRICLLHNWKMSFFSPEFYPCHEHVAQIIETIGGKRFERSNYSQEDYEILKGWVANNVFWIDPDDTDLQSILDRAAYYIRKRGIKALVIDPFNSITDKSRGNNTKQDEYISEFMQRLRWFARRYDILVVVVMHPRKMTKLDNDLYPIADLYDCKGASEIYDKADIGLTVWRNEKCDYAKAVVTKIKFRHLGRKGEAFFQFNPFNGRYGLLSKQQDLKDKVGTLDSIGEPNVTVDQDFSNWLKMMDAYHQLTEPTYEQTTIQPNAKFEDQSDFSYDSAEGQGTFTQEEIENLSPI